MSLSNSSFILLDDGTIKACGNNSYGQLGLGDNIDRNTFTIVPGINNVKKIVQGNGYTVILLNDGTIKACGDNSNGQLGLGDNVNRNIFTTVSGVINVVDIACGYNHTIILRNDQTAIACGYNNYGQLADGTKTKRNKFQMINISGVKGIACTAYGTILIFDMLLRVCGSNVYGELCGNGGTNIDYLTNMSISNVKQISCGYSHTFILLNDGTIKSCGANANGQLGLNTTNNTANAITTVSGISNVKQILCGYDYTFILLNDGTIKACGWNNNGQLGLNDYINRKTFTSVSDIDNVKQITCSYGHTFILLNDGNIKSCGYNGSGQLGLGDTIKRKVFTIIPNKLTKYLINKKSEPNNLYTIDSTKPDLLQGVTTKDTMNFTDAFTKISDITTETQYGKPIDKINENFTIYSNTSNNQVIDIGM